MDTLHLKPPGKGSLLLHEHILADAKAMETAKVEKWLFSERKGQLNAAPSRGLLGLFFLLQPADRHTDTGAQTFYRLTQLTNFIIPVEPGDFQIKLPLTVFVSNLS